MRLFLLALFIISGTFSHAQQTDTFKVKAAKPLHASVVSKTDTFVQLTFVSDKPEARGRIVYRTGFKIINKNFLIYFKATQSYIDSFGIAEERNVDIGTWIKVPYTWNNDTLFFIIKRSFSSTLNPGTTVVETRGFKGIKQADSILMTTDITSEPSETKPRQESSGYTLYRRDYAITKFR